MADEEGASGLLWLAIAAALLIIVAVPWMIPGPGVRQYPHRKVVRFWHVWTGDWEKVVDNICDQFNASQTEYEVIPLSVPGDDADSKFLIAVAGDDPPDCMAQWQDVIPNWAESKLVVPLDTLMAPDEWARQQKSIFPAALRIGMFKGHLYGLTVGMNVYGLYYRPDYLREAGLDPDKFPTTLEGLSDWAAKLDKVDSDGNLTRVGWIPWGMRNFAPIFGGGLFDWNTNSLTLDTPDNMRALDWLVAQHGRLGFDRVVRFEASQHNASGGEGDWPFMTGAMAIDLDGQWRVQEVKRLAPDFDYRTAPIPPPAGGQRNSGFCNGNFMVIPSSAHDVAGAWAFIKFWSGLTDPDRAAKFYTAGGWLPMNRQVRDAPVYRDYIRQNPQFKTFVDLLDSPNLYPIPPVPYQVYLSDRVDRMEESACSGNATPMKAMAQLVLEMKRELRLRKEYGYVD
jgi:multiple sugar transport system substrate-binding protein